MKKEFYLCYVDGNMAWFTNDWKHQWGDDWNDKPYEDNAGEPYSTACFSDGEPVNELPIELKKVMFRTNDWSAKYPCDLGKFSVEQINKGAIAWIITDKYSIPAKTTYEDFIKILTSNGGEVFVPYEK